MSLFNAGADGCHRAQVVSATGQADNSALASLIGLRTADGYPHPGVDKLQIIDFEGDDFRPAKGTEKPD